MIPRYSRPEMTAIWSPETKYRIWFEIEAHVCDARAQLGLMPEASAKNIWEKGGSAIFDIDRIDEIERQTKHDVIAFLTHLAEIIGEDSRHVHLGLTSSDVLDTCYSIQCSRAADLLLEGLEKLLGVIKTKAFEHQNTVTIGRSHGIHAEPTTFGLKLAQSYAEMKRNHDKLVLARSEIAVCCISGAVGTYANIDPRIEKTRSKGNGTYSRTHIHTSDTPRPAWILLYDFGTHCFIY